MGKEAYEFADFLHASGMRIWQVLPMGPTGYGESPYQSSSVYAGNPMLISCEKMREDGLVEYEDSEEFAPAELSRVDFPSVRENREKLLRRAFHQSEKSHLDEIKSFIRSNDWVRDFALFTAVKHHFSDQMWTKWPDEGIKMRQPEALKRYRQDLDEDVRFHIFCQWVFDRQWAALKAYCNSLSISLFGDMPIYVAEDSADTWTHPEVFQLDKNRVPARVAGVPPDYFSADGQLWGNPLYRWTYLRFHGYKWWVERMGRMAKMYDIIRIDHFIGFANYYSVPHGAPNAKNGKWIVGPGKSLFRVLRRKLPGLNIVAEDLGCVNDRVKRLLAYVKYPGMKVLTFGFGSGEDNPHLSSHYTENCVAYTGTHDNDTVLGFLRSADEKTVTHAMEYLHFTDMEDAPEAFIREVMACRADTAVIPMQDVLGLGAEARMNTPSTIGGNWLWRMTPQAASPAVAQRLRLLNEENNRL